MRSWLPALILLAAAAAPTPEPATYWQGPTDAPTPATIAGGTVIHTASLIARLSQNPPLLIDVANAPRRPPNLPSTAIWLPLAHRDIPHSIWIPGAGLANISAQADAAYRTRLDELTAHNPAHPIVIYCHERCWLSWNAAKRAINDGYTNVAWYPDGVEGWSKSAQPTAITKPDR